jgi:hypothetical protein
MFVFVGATAPDGNSTIIRAPWRRQGIMRQSGAVLGRRLRWRMITLQPPTRAAGRATPISPPMPDRHRGDNHFLLFEQIRLNLISLALRYGPAGFGSGRLRHDLF